jgi:hypothetical protein
MTDDPHARSGGRTTLVANGPFRVECCGCGTLHVTIGAVTIRLPPPAFASLIEALMRAADRITVPTAATTH